MQHNGCLLLPATGNVNRVDGAGINRGTNGNYWSCDTDGTRTPRLNFNSSGADMYAEVHSFGLTVRCVQAFTVLLPFFLMEKVK